MQSATDTALAAAVDSRSRVVVQKLEADWRRDGQYNHPLSDLTDWVSAVQVQRDQAGSLPEQTSIIEGFIAARLDFTLEGVRAADGGKDVVDLLSPLRTDSPIYGDGRTGIPVRWRLGLQTDAGTVPMLDQFTGTISTFQANTNPRQVVVTCLDGTDRLHTPLTLPYYSLPNWSSQLNPVFAPAKFRINSHWVIDHVLRQNGIYQSPPPQPGCFYSATGHGSMIPEIGHQFQFWFSAGSFTDDSVSTVPGKWGYAFNGGASFASQWISRANSVFNPVPNSSYLIQAMVDFAQVPNQNSQPEMALMVMGSSRGFFITGTTTVAFRIAITGQLFVQFYNGASLVATINGPTFTAPVWTHVWVRIDFGATLANSVVSFPTMTVNPANLSGLSSAPGTYPYASLATGVPYPVQNLQISNVTGMGAIGTYDPVAWTPQCDLDIGLNEFSSLPVVKSTDSLDILKSVVGAEFGVAGFTESGRFFFKNRNALRKNNLAIDKVYSADTNLGQLSVVEQPGAVRNSIVTKTRNLTQLAHYETVFTIQDIDDIIANPGFSVTRIILSEPGWVYDSDVLSFVDMATWDLEPNPTQLHNKFHTIGVNNFTTVGTGIGVAIQTDPVALAAGRDEALLLITNNNSVAARFSTEDGRPALDVGGQPVHEETEIVRTYERAGSITRYGKQVLELEANPWRQLPAYMQPIALSLLKDLKAPVPLFNPITVVGDPRVQLGDTALLKDPGGLGGPYQVGVYSVQRTLTEGKLVDTLVLRGYAAPGRWILGHPTLSVLGQTTILG